MVSRFDDPLCLIVIAWTQHRHIRNCAKRGDVLYALVRASVARRRDARMTSGNFYVRFAVCRCISDNFKRSSGSKHCKRRCEGHVADFRQADGHTDQILFGDTGFDIAVGKLFLKSQRTGRMSQIRVEDNHIGIFFTELDEAVAVALPCCFFFAHISCPPIL